MRPRCKPSNNDTLQKLQKNLQKHSAKKPKLHANKPPKHWKNSKQLKPS